MSKTPEEKAREYVVKEWCEECPHLDTCDSIGFECTSAIQGKEDYLSGYHYRDEEVKELKEALEEAVSLICQGTEYEVEIKRYREFVAKAKQLLNKQ